MKNKLNKPKIMCPIRDWASLEACKDYADEVYFSVSSLSLRSKSNNFSLAELPKFVEKCKSYGIKPFLVINSVIYNNDLKTAEKIIKAAKEAGVYAVIIWDLALMELAKKEKLKFVVSTQANISNYETANFYKKLGASRVVLAREMTLKQIKETIKKAEGIEIETFIHGAMCFSISGRCLLSAGLYDKSANCGACAQPCRKEWFLVDEEGKKISNSGKYFMSAEDLCMVEYIPELIEAGIDSFKIEGRRRDPKYIEITARVYREAIDFYMSLRGMKRSEMTKQSRRDCRAPSGLAMTKEQQYKEKAKKWKEELKSVYNRGFGTGFYFGTPEKEGISFDKADNQSPYRKILAGRVIHYYPKPKVVLVRLSNHGIKKGQEIIFENSKDYKRFELDSMEIENKQVNSAKKGEDVGIKVGKRLKNDTRVFVVTKI